MRPVKRFHSNKRQSAHKFRKNVSHTKRVNVSPTPMRGGIRL